MTDAAAHSAYRGHDGGMQLGGLATGAPNLSQIVRILHPIQTRAPTSRLHGRRWRWYLGSQVSSGRGYARVLPESWSMPWWRPTRLPLVWLSLVGDLTGSLVAGNVYRYEDHVLEPNVIQYRRVGMWTARDAPARVLVPARGDRVRLRRQPPFLRRRGRDRGPRARPALESQFSPSGRRALPALARGHSGRRRCSSPLALRASRFGA